MMPRKPRLTGVRRKAVQKEVSPSERAPPSDDSASSTAVHGRGEGDDAVNFRNLAVAGIDQR